MHQISISTGAPPQTPLGGGLKALPRLPSWIKRVLFLREGKGAEGKGEGGKGKGERGAGLEPPPLQISGYATESRHLDVTYDITHKRFFSLWDIFADTQPCRLHVTCATPLHC